MGNPWPILVIEDNPVIRKLLEKTLIKAGYQVVAANNGRAGLDLLQNRFFPIVITDWMMPEMDGIELCKAIRSQDFEGYVYLIFLTAKDSKDDIVIGLEAGADDYLIKPVHPAELLARLNTGKRIIELERSLKERSEEIAQLSITDPLTRIYNRGFLNERLPMEIKRALRYRKSLSLIMCDIDHFKKINDKHGHRAGDLVLQELAACLKQHIRDGIDWLARYGGEEFVIVLPETDLTAGCQAAERYRLRVSEQVIQAEAGPITITASFGVASFNPDRTDKAMTMETLLGEADRCLYKAKKAGRNRVRGAWLGR